jgi:endonuclease/exonuclease/phosphatase (EEP) superfamily protein YafD
MTGPQLLVCGLLVLGWASTLLTFVRVPTWWVRFNDFPRLQVSAVLVAGIAGSVALFEPPTSWAMAAVAAVALGVQLWNVFPYTPFVAAEVPRSPDRADGDVVSLLAVNVQMDNHDGERILQQVRDRDADVLFLVEVDEAWLERLQSATERYAFHRAEPRDNYYGLLFCTHLEVLDFEIRHLTDAEHPSVRARLRTKGGREIVFYGLHPDPPTPFDGTEVRDSDLIKVAREVADCDLPAVAAGDLNDVGWSYTTRLFRRTSGMLDPRIGRGMYATFHARYPLMRWPLDHLFHTAQFTLGALQVLGYNGSDHFPMYAELHLGAPERVEAKPPPDPDTEDEEQADRIVARGIAAGLPSGRPESIGGGAD